MVITTLTLDKGGPELGQQLRQLHTSLFFVLFPIIAEHIICVSVLDWLFRTSLQSLLLT